MDKDRIILDVLARHKDPVSLHELYAAMEQGASERTLRRLLKVLVEQGQVLATEGKKTAGINSCNPLLLWEGIKKLPLTPSQNPNI